MTQDPRESQLTEIYQRALAQSPSERERFLEEACGDNDALRHDVQSLLALAPLADRFMESPAVAMVAPALSDGSQVSRPADIIGRALGPYTVTSRIDSGAMGDVYRARDTKLGRDVAIKILPPHLTNDPERRTRFAREARVLAALNHPHIGAIYGLEEGSGISGLVLELVEGQTLAAIIERGQVPIRKLLDIAVQIADGMASAHAAGITHRDLKPANIMVAADSRVKILDFGLAKQKTVAAAAVEATTPADRTEPGMIVGTVNYMSPEQARGEIVDYRTDQFSFGVVLYEMATGRKPFARAGSVQTMAAIISEDPPPIDTRMPAPLRWVIDRCLAKDPAGRYESSRDLFRELAGVRDHLSEISREVPQAAEIATTERRVWRRWTIPAALALGAAIAVAVVAARSGPALPDQSSYRFTPFSFEPGGQGGAVWSPDGKAVAYAARQKTSDPYQLYVRYLDAPAAVQVTHLTTSVFPVAWSPDSRRVFLLKDEQKPALWSVATVGGDPEIFMSLPDVNAYAADSSAILFELERRSGSVAISPDNQSVAVLMTPGLRVGISSPPGAPLKIYEPAPYETKATFNEPRLRFSPDGRRLLLALNAGRGDEEAWLLPYPPDGTTRPKRVLPGLPSFGGTPTFNWLPDSRHVVLSLQAAPDAYGQLWLADTTTGERHALTSGTERKRSPSIAPDGTRLVFTEEKENYDVVSVDFATLTPETLIATDRRDLMPAWAAAGQVLAYVTDRGGPTEIWLHRPGVPDRPVVTAGDFPAGSTRWLWGPALSPKGDRLVYARIDTSTNSSLWISSAAGGTPIQLTSGAGTTSELPGSWSPDGGWFVYTAVRDGKRSLLKVKTSGQATPVVLKEVGGIVKVPEWSPAGNWISYDNELISPDGKTTKSLGDRGSYHYMFSPDGTLLYGLRTEKDRQVLFSIEIATGAEKVIGPISPDFTPRSFIHPSIRFSLAPDGKSFVYGSGTAKTNLWMLEGFARPKRWLLGVP